jgi:hypothetical protein
MNARGDDRDPIDELAMLADDLLQQATEIRRQWEELGEALGLDLPAPTPEAAPEPLRPPAGAAAGATTSGAADPVRLVALDMMLSGSSRDEVVQYLSATFGDHVDESVVDEVFSGG